MRYSFFVITACLLSLPAQGADFVIKDGEKITTQQLLHDNETGTIQSGGLLAAPNVAIEALGNNSTITVSGVVSTTGDFAVSILSIGADNTMTVSGKVLATGKDTVGILSFGTDNTMTVSGKVVATGKDAIGIYSVGNDANITNSGLIQVTGKDAFGVDSSGDNTNITNSGSIQVTGKDAYGIFSTGNNANITHSGSTATVGDDADGIFSTGNNANITHSGSIATEGDSAVGISAIGDNTNIVSGGSIATTGDNGYGIISTGDTANIILTRGRSIATVGDNADGIHLNGDNVSITNSGLIITEKEFSDGIYSAGDNSALTNSGSIATAGVGATGIYSAGDNSNITNSGSITTAGVGANAIYSHNNNMKLFSGESTITIEYFADGIFSFGDGDNIVNSGSIATVGEYVNGIFSFGDGVNIVNSGSIRVTGKDAVGISSYGADSTVTVSGEVLATGQATTAVRGHNNHTLNLLPGFRILGALDLGDDGTVNITTRDNTASSTLIFESVDAINLHSTMPAVRSGNMVTMIDPTGHAATGAALGRTTLSVHTAVNQQLYHQDSRPTAWSRAFGSRTKRGDDGTALAYDSNSYGFIGGYEGTLRGHRAGVFAGFSQTKVKTDITSTNIDTDSYFIGAYGQREMNRWRLNGAVMGGFETHDGTRTLWDNLNGRETARSEYDSFYISPSLTLEGTYKGPLGVRLQPSVQLIYTYGSYESYRETGATASNLAVDGRGVNVANGRLQLAVARAFGVFDVGLRGGLNVRHHGKDRVDIDFNGSPLAFNRPGERTVLGGYFGAHIGAAVNDRLSLAADIEYAEASRNEKSHSAHLRASLSF